MNSTQQTDAFLTVVQANKGIIYKVANLYCRIAEDREDLVQEIIYQLWKSFGSYAGEYKFSTWMYRIALNVAVSFYRKQSRRKSFSNPLSEGILHFADTTAALETEEEIGFLQQFIAGLKDLDKALMLLYLEEKSHAEIAGIIGISETYVSTKISRIKKQLQQKFLTIK